MNKQIEHCCTVRDISFTATPEVIIKKRRHYKKDGGFYYKPSTEFSGRIVYNISLEIYTDALNIGETVIFRNAKTFYAVSASYFSDTPIIHLKSTAHVYREDKLDFKLSDFSKFVIISQMVKEHANT